MNICLSSSRAFLAFFILCGGCNSISQSDELTQKDFVVVDSSIRPTVVTGLIPTYAAFTVWAPGEETITVFVPYMAKDQFLPSRGDRCRIDFRLGTVGGVVGTLNLYLSKIPVADQFVCGARSWRNPTMKDRATR